MPAIQTGSLIVNADTDHEEARIFDRWIRQFDDPNLYLVAHLGFGFDPRADLESFDLAAWESYYGGVVVAFGANTAPQLGGGTSATGHMDGILLKPTSTSTAFRSSATANSWSRPAYFARLREPGHPHRYPGSNRHLAG